MANVEIIYDLIYSEEAEGILQRIGRNVFSDGAQCEYLGQTGYMTESELQRFIRLLELKPGSKMLEIGCGGGGCAVYVASKVQAHVTGIDLSTTGIRKAKRLALSNGVESRTRFDRADASQPLAFEVGAFDAVLSSDAMLHIARRDAVLCECHRVLKPGGLMLFTDAAVLTGIISTEEISVPGQVGSGHLVPPGLNEGLIQKAGFELLGVEDLTPSVEQIAQRIFDGFTRHRTEIAALFGEEIVSGLQTHYAWKYTLAKERRLSRYMYLGRKPFTPSA
jgi:cyclopropane fatty-acyl-phospholipid synthase-like methyltransferase